MTIVSADSDLTENTFASAAPVQPAGGRADHRRAGHPLRGVGIVVSQLFCRREVMADNKGGEGERGGGRGEG